MYKHYPYDYSMDSFIKVLDLDFDHSARKYLNIRKIPNIFLKEIYYTENWEKYLDKLKNVVKKPEDIYPKTPRIVIPCYDKTGTITTIHSRIIDFDISFKISTSVDYNIKRYNTIYNNLNINWFGFDRVDNNKTVYILEGPIDSMFVENSVGGFFLAINETYKIGVLLYNNLSKYFNDYVICLDNEPYKSHIIKMMNKIILDDKKLFIWPKYLKGLKDINDMIIAGFTTEEIMIILKENTFQGQQAKDKFLEWLYVE